MPNDIFRDVEVIQLICTKLLLKGKGVEGDPYRTLVQYWKMDGTLVFEYDPFKDEARKR